MDKKYLLFTATRVGLGHLMVALLGSAFYAYHTGRILAMDMRESAYFKNDGHSAFFENFELQVPDGLEVMTDLQEIDALKRHPDMHFVTLSTPLDIARPFPNKVVMVPCLTPGTPFRPAMRRADQVFRINLKAQFAEALAQVLAAPVWRKRVIGLHYRAAVGELFDRMAKVTVPDYDERFQAIKDNYVATATGLVEGLDPDCYAFMVASDDRDFVTEMKQRLPNAFSIDAKRLDQEVLSYLSANKHDVAILVGAVTDLWALSHCEQLIHSQSAFSDLAILNSEHLGEGNTHLIHRPGFDEILLTLAPETAVEWARAAVRKVDVKRMNYSGMHRSLAKALDRAGQRDEAAYVRQQAAWHDEVSRSPELDSPDVFDERAEHLAGKQDVALGRARRAAAAMPNNPYLQGGYGGSLTARLLFHGRNAEAVEAARRAVALDPRDAFLRDHLGYVLGRAGEHAAAEAAFRAAVGMLPDVVSFQINHADALAKLDRLAEAIDVMQRAVALDPENGRAHTVLGEIFLRAEDYKQAETALRRAVGLLNDDPGVQHRLSIALERQGQYKEALELAKAVADKLPESADLRRRVVSLMTMGGDKRVVEAELRAALAVTPDDVRLHRALVHELATQGRQEDLMRALEEATKAVPDDAEFVTRHGTLLLGAGRYPEAELALCKAVALSPGVFGPHHLLSITLERQGRLDDAILEAVAACKIDPRNTDLSNRVLALAQRFAREHTPA